MKNSSAQSGMIDDEFQEAAAFKVAELSDTQTKLGWASTRPLYGTLIDRLRSNALHLRLGRN